MFLPKIKRYQKKFEYSYAFGAFPVIDLIKMHKDRVYKVLLKTGTENSEGILEIIDMCKTYGIPYEYADRSIEKISFKENTYVVGIFEKYTSQLDKDTNHLVLANPRNMGNIGTIIRTMLGFGFYNLAIIKPAADIFDPKVIRSTMGAIFHINFEYFDNIQQYIEKYPKQNLYPFMLDGAKNIKEIEFKYPISIIQGNESQGLNEEYKNIGQSIYIPHSDKIDSLNLSVATAIGLWESTKK